MKPESCCNPNLLHSSFYLPGGKTNSAEAGALSFVAGMSHIWFELQEMHFHTPLSPPAKLFTLNKQNPRDFVRFWLWDNFGAAFTENSRLVLHFIPSGSSTPRSPRGRHFQRATVPWNPLAGNAAGSGRGSDLDHSVFRFQSSIFPCVIYASSPPFKNVWNCLRYVQLY